MSYCRRLTDDEKASIRSLRRQDWTLEEIADYVGCSLQTAFRVANENAGYYKYRAPIVHHPVNAHVAGPDITRAKLMAGR